MLGARDRAVRDALRGMVDMFERHIDGRPGPDDAAVRWDAARAALARLDAADAAPVPCLFPVLPCSCGKCDLDSVFGD
jgi:hypothetical protein